MTALEGGPHGVTSNCVNPSYVRTPLVEKQIADQARVHGIAEDEVVEQVHARPSRRSSGWSSQTRSPTWSPGSPDRRRLCQRRVAVDRRRMDGAMKKLLVFLVVVGLLAVVADRVAAKLATDEAKRRLVSAGLTSPAGGRARLPVPDPGAVAAIRRRPGQRDLGGIGTGAPTTSAAPCSDVKVPSSGPATAGRLTRAGTIPTPRCSRQVDQPGCSCSNAGAGKVELRREVSVLGRDLLRRRAGRVEPDGNRLLVTPTSVQLAGGGAIDSRLSSLIKDRFTSAIASVGCRTACRSTASRLRQPASSSTSRAATSGW